MSHLLLQPPALKPSEPPLALATLAGYLRPSFRVEVLDANLAAYRYLLDEERLLLVAGSELSTSDRRALRHRQGSLELLCTGDGLSFPRYSTAVRYLNHLLSFWWRKDGRERLTLGDYQQPGYSVFNPGHLARFASGEARTLFRGYYLDQLIPQLAAQPPRLVAISINYLHQVFPAFELAGLLRRQFPYLTLVAGGGLISSWQAQLRQARLQLPVFDHLIFGPGERPLRQLLQGSARMDYLLEGGQEIAFQPDFAGFPLTDYFSPRRVLPLSSARGCYWQQCLFCPEATAPVHPFRQSLPEQFPALLQDYAARYGVDCFHLTDNAIPVAILKALADSPPPANEIRWFGFVRFESCLEDPQFVRRLAASGCQLLQLGLESGSQQVLDRLGKGIRLEAAAQILENLAAAGIGSYVYIMLGTPGETREDAEQTRSFLLRHAAKISFLNLSIMNLPQASELAQSPDQYGIAATEPLAEAAPLGLYRRFTPDGDWNRAATRRFLAKQLLGEPAIREIVRRTPTSFSSNHAVFFRP